MLAAPARLINPAQAFAEPLGNRRQHGRGDSGDEEDEQEDGKECAWRQGVSSAGERSNVMT